MDREVELIEETVIAATDKESLTVGFLHPHYQCTGNSMSV